MQCGLKLSILSVSLSCFTLFFFFFFCETILQVCQPGQLTAVICRTLSTRTFYDKLTNIVQQFYRHFSVYYYPWYDVKHVHGQQREVFQSANFFFLADTSQLSFYFHSGHLLFEMLAGWELTTAEPKREQLTNFRNVPVVEVCERCCNFPLKKK